jgi:hypothetical protein
MMLIARLPYFFGVDDVGYTNVLYHIEFLYLILAVYFTVLYVTDSSHSRESSAVSWLRCVAASVFMLRVVSIIPGNYNMISGDL